MTTTNLEILKMFSIYSRKQTKILMETSPFPVANRFHMGYNGILLNVREENTMAEITESKNFIHAFIDEDIAEGGRYAGQTVHTRFPPNPTAICTSATVRR